MPIETDSSSGTSGHALVVGGSMAGRDERVTIQNPRLDDSGLQEEVSGLWKR